jgi:hypothetical protein
VGNPKIINREHLFDIYIINKTCNHATYLNCFEVFLMFHVLLGFGHSFGFTQYLNKNAIIKKGKKFEQCIVPCDQQLCRSQKALKSWPCVVRDGSISGCIYPFQFKFGNYCRNSAKQATALYVNSSLLKTPL